ncbi:DUF177 domain-containing protein [Aquabacter sp. CN5-332]|uniref:YceD family protein n=1 Tax=Aquabacter sp. CN5-332 TaxID=3156608 RepID=UPI0032B40084
MPDIPYSHIVRVAELPSEGVAVHLEPDARTLAELARHVDLIALHALAADLKVVPTAGDGAQVTGRLTAEVRQMSVVSLEPFDSRIEEEVDVLFMPESEATAAPETEEGDPDYDPPDPLVDGNIDLGAIVTEFLALGIDPYPRRPGEVFEAPEEDEAAASPFAALARLKDKP